MHAAVEGYSRLQIMLPGKCDSLLLALALLLPGIHGMPPKNPFTHPWHHTSYDYYDQYSIFSPEEEEVEDLTSYEEYGSDNNESNVSRAGSFIFGQTQGISNEFGIKKFL